MALLATTRRLSFVLGAVAAGAAIAHLIAVTGVAVQDGRGYDVRLADLLAIGLLPLACGAAMLAGARLMRRDTELGLAWSAAGAGAMSLVVIVLWPALTSGSGGSLAGTFIGLAAFLALAVLAMLARRPTRVRHEPRAQTHGT